MPNLDQLRAAFERAGREFRDADQACDEALKGDDMAAILAAEEALALANEAFIAAARALEIAERGEEYRPAFQRDLARARAEAGHVG